MRLFCISFDENSEVYTEEQFINFIHVAVFNNRDIAIFKVVEIDPRLNRSQGFNVAQRLGFGSAYMIDTKNGLTPFESVISHIHLR